MSRTTASSGPSPARGPGSAGLGCCCRIAARVASELRVAAVTFSEMRPSPSPSAGKGLLSSRMSSSASIAGGCTAPGAAASESPAEALRPRPVGAGRPSSAMTRLMEARISSIDGS